MDAQTKEQENSSLIMHASSKLSNRLTKTYNNYTNGIV